MIYFLILFNFIIGQVITDHSFNSSRSIALAGATVSNPGIIESVFSNPANLSNSKQSSFVVGHTVYYEQDFLDYNYCSILYKPTRKTNLALTIQKLGTKTRGSNQAQDLLSSEQSITLSQGFALLEDRNSSLRLGYNINYLILKQGRTAGTLGDGSNGLAGSKITTIGIDAGILATLREKIMMGIFMKNINSPSIGRTGASYYLPRKMNIGFSYIPISTLITSFNYERVLSTETNQFQFGIEYKIHKFFTLRSGIQMKPNKIGFGFMASINNNSSLSYGFITDPILPLTHNIEIGLMF